LEIKYRHVVLAWSVVVQQIGPVPSSDRLLKASNISYIELTVGLTEIGRELIGKNFLI